MSYSGQKLLLCRYCGDPRGQWADTYFCSDKCADLFTDRHIFVTLYLMKNNGRPQFKKNNYSRKDHHHQLVK